MTALRGRRTTPAKRCLLHLEELEPRFTPSPLAVLIPSANPSDPAVNGAEHACPGLDHADHNPNQALQMFRHGCDCMDYQPPPTPGGSVPPS
jgi:hypothetical protein